MFDRKHHHSVPWYAPLCCGIMPTSPGGRIMNFCGFNCQGTFSAQQKSRCSNFNRIHFTCGSILLNLKTSTCDIKKLNCNGIISQKIQLSISKLIFDYQIFNDITAIYIIFVKNIHIYFLISLPHKQ